jgi:hypothetical protein
MNDGDKARLTFKPCGRLGVWIYFDGEVIDLFHLSDLNKMFGIKQKTKDAIELIYDEIILDDYVVEE